VRVVTSGHMKKMAVTAIRHIRKPHATRKLHGSTFYKTGVVVNQCYIAGIEIIVP